MEKRKQTVENTFQHLVDFHGMFLRSFDALYHAFQRQHFGHYEELSLNRPDHLNADTYYQETMIRAEEILKQIEQRYKTNMSLEEIMGDMFIELDQMKTRLHQLLLECGKDNMYLMNKNEEIIKLMTHCQQSLVPPDNQEEEMAETSEKQQVSSFEKFKNVFDQVIKNIMIPNTLHEYFVQEEVDQIKKWIGMTFKSILFDSNYITIDSKNILQKLLKNKEHLLFLLMDQNQNRFGAYLSSCIDETDTWIADPNAFLFSLTSNGRLDGMQRFAFADQQKVFYLSTDDNDPLLFSFGASGDITINIPSTLPISESNFSLDQCNYVLTGQQFFIPQRLIIIELKELPLPSS